MNLQIESAVLEVQPRALVHLHVSTGLRVTGVSGTLWITMDGDPVDVILEPGETHAFAGEGHALVQALGGDAELVAEEGIEVDRDPHGRGAPGRGTSGAKTLLGRLLRKQP